MPNFAAAAPGPTGPQLTTAGQSPAYQQTAFQGAPGLPQHVIDTGNLLRANRIAITPLTMYVSQVLGPQAMVDLVKRTRSMASAAVPPLDQATADQMGTWARQLRLGDAAPAGIAGGMAPVPNLGPAMTDQSNDGAFDSAQSFA